MEDMAPRPEASACGVELSKEAFWRILDVNQNMVEWARLRMASKNFSKGMRGDRWGQWDPKISAEDLSKYAASLSYLTVERLVVGEESARWDYTGSDEEVLTSVIAEVTETLARNATCLPRMHRLLKSPRWNLTLLVLEEVDLQGAKMGIFNKCLLEMRGSLVTLELFECPTDDAVAIELASPSALKHLLIKQADRNSQWHLQEMFKSLVEMQVKSFLVDACHPNGPGYTSLCIPELKTNSYMEELKLTRVYMMEGFLARLCCCFSSLKILMLHGITPRYDYLRNSGMEWEGLKQLKQLEYLNIWGVADLFRDGGMVRRGLGEMSSLRTVILQDMNIVSDFSFDVFRIPTASLLTLIELRYMSVPQEALDELDAAQFNCKRDLEIRIIGGIHNVSREAEEQTRLFQALGLNVTTPYFDVWDDREWKSALEFELGLQ